MAQKIVTICDLDKCGREDAAETTLAFNGDLVAIDLCPAHLSAVSDALSELLRCGRPAKQTQVRTKRKTRIAATVEVPPRRLSHAGHGHKTKYESTQCRARMLAEAAAS